MAHPTASWLAQADLFDTRIEGLSDKLWTDSDAQADSPLNEADEGDGRGWIELGASCV